MRVKKAVSTIDIEKPETASLFPPPSQKPLYPFARPPATNGHAANTPVHGLIEEITKDVTLTNAFAHQSLAFNGPTSDLLTPLPAKATAQTSPSDTAEEAASPVSDSSQAPHDAPEVAAASADSVATPTPIKLETSSTARPPVGLPLVPEVKPMGWQALPGWSKYAFAAVGLAAVYFLFMALLGQDHALQEFRERHRATAAVPAIPAPTVVETPVVAELPSPPPPLPTIESVDVREVPVKSLHDTAAKTLPPKTPSTAQAETKAVAVKKATPHASTAAPLPAPKPSASPSAPPVAKPALTPAPVEKPAIQKQNPATMTGKPPSEQGLIQLLNKQ